MFIDCLFGAVPIVKQDRIASSENVIGLLFSNDLR